MNKRQYILTTLQQLMPSAAEDPLLTADAPAADGPAAGGAGAADGAARPEGEIQWINMRIFSRLGVGFLLFVNGSSVGRVKLFFAVSAIYYVIETGIIVYLLKKFLGDMYSVPPTPAPVAAPAAPAVPGVAGAAEGAPDTPNEAAAAEAAAGATAATRVPPPPPPATPAAPAEDPSLVRQAAQLLLQVCPLARLECVSQCCIHSHPGTRTRLLTPSCGRYRNPAPPSLPAATAACRWTPCASWHLFSSVSCQNGHRTDAQA